MSRSLLVALALPLLAAPAAADVKRLGELNTAQIRALDRAKTVVLLPGGILEEHGPYLPAWTDWILSERMTAELAQGIAAAKKDWTVLVFPQVAVGASGYNEVGGHFTFPGTYAVRPSTLRAVFMDLASELGDQGFRWIFVVHVHGAPRHNRVLDQAGDYFHDTYGGRMVHVVVPPPGGRRVGQGAAEPHRRGEEGGGHRAARRHGRDEPDAPPRAGDAEIEAKQRAWLEKSAGKAGR